MTAENITALLALVLIFGTGIAIAVSIAWFDHRTRTKAIDVLRIYAERGEEPPASVVQTLTPISGWPRQGWPRQPDVTGPQRSTRGRYLAHVAANTVFVAGLSWLAWWRFSATGEAGRWRKAKGAQRS